MINRRFFLSGATVFPVDGFADGEYKTVYTPLVQTYDVQNKFRQGRVAGFCIDKLKSRCLDKGYFDAIARTHAKICRIFISLDLPSDAANPDSGPFYGEQLERVLDWCYQYNIYIIVSTMLSPKCEVEFWRSAIQRREMALRWMEVGRLYGRHPAFLAIDLLNEPNPQSAGMSFDSAQSLWMTCAESMVYGLRSVGFNKSIVIESIGGGQPVGFKNLEPIKDEGIIYSFHLYTPHNITHQFVSPEWNIAIPYPAEAHWRLKDAVLIEGGWDASRMNDSLKNVLDFQLKYKKPIYVGEFSCVRWAPGKSTYKYLTDCMKIFKKNNWSWTYHEFRGWTGWDSEVDSNLIDRSPRGANAPIFNLINNGIMIQANV